MKTHDKIKRVAPNVSAKRSHRSACRLGTNHWCISSVIPNTTTQMIDKMMLSIALVVWWNARYSRMPSMPYSTPCTSLSLRPNKKEGRCWLGYDRDERRTIMPQYRRTGAQCFIRSQLSDGRRDVWCFIQLFLGDLERAIKAKCL